MDSEVFVGGVILGTIGAGVIMITGAVAHGVNALVVLGTDNSANRKIVAAKNELNRQVGEEINLSDFSIASVELANSGENSIMKVFGSTSVEEIVGLKEQRYLNVFFNISNDSAEEVLEAAEAAAKTARTSRNTPELVNKYGESNYFKFSESGKINKNKNAVIELYNKINSAVKNAYSSKIENISEASKFNNQISKEYRYARPDIITNEVNGRISVYIDSTFVNNGIITTNVSQVVKNFEKNMSYFLVDTLQVRSDGANAILESCRARIEVKGTNLSQEEVYAQFLAGNATMTEIIREKAGFKTGIMENEIKDINEIEMF